MPVIVNVASLLAPSVICRATTRPLPVLARFRLAPSASANAPPVALRVPTAPLLLLMVAPVVTVSGLITVAPAAMSSVLALSVIVPPAVPLPLTRSVPALTVVPPA